MSVKNISSEDLASVFKVSVEQAKQIQKNEALAEARRRDGRFKAVAVMLVLFITLIASWFVLGNFTISLPWGIEFVWGQVVLTVILIAPPLAFIFVE